MVRKEHMKIVFRLGLGFSWVAYFMFFAGCSPMNWTGATKNKNSEELKIGMAGIQGRIVSRLNHDPLKGKLVRLAEVYRKGASGAYVLDDANSPGGYSNDEGIFFILNVKPGDYVLVIGDVMGSFEIIKEKSGMAKVWKLVPNQVVSGQDILTDLNPD